MNANDNLTRENAALSEKHLEERPLSFSSTLFQGKVVLVSGGGTGIGRAMVWMLSRLGAQVVTCGRSLDKLTNVKDSLVRLGREITVFQADIRNVEQVAELYDSIFERFGRVDLVINNAGGQFPKPAIELSENGFRAVVENNLFGTWNMMQAVARRWRDRDMDGSIVNVVAVVERGVMGAAHTAAARAGVISLSKTVAVEWAPLRIRVNCMAPGVIFTEGMAGYPEEAKREFYRSNPMLRLGDPWECAEACLFIGSDASSFTTGEVLVVDGGGQMWGEVWTSGKPDYFKEKNQ